MITIDVTACPVKFEFKTTIPPVAAYSIPSDIHLHRFRLIKGMIADRLVRGDWTINLPVFQDGNKFLLVDYYQEFSKRFDTLESAIAWANEVEARNYPPEGMGVIAGF